MVYQVKWYRECLVTLTSPIERDHLILFHLISKMNLFPSKNDSCYTAQLLNSTIFHAKTVLQR